MASPLLPSKRRKVPVPLEEATGRYTLSLSAHTAYTGLCPLSQEKVMAPSSGSPVRTGISRAAEATSAFRLVRLVSSRSMPRRFLPEAAACTRTRKGGATPETDSRDSPERCRRLCPSLWSSTR